MNRRSFLVATAASLTIGGLDRLLASAAGENKHLSEIRRNWKAFVAPDADISNSAEPIRRSTEEWRQALSPIQYAILREAGTEPAGSSPLDREHRPGLFVCLGCALPLFTSEMRFDSHTGWPSFFTSIPDHLKVKSDFRFDMTRIEYHCVRCSSHQGHLFPDGPPPTGERWCNNGVSLRFIPL